MDQRQDKIHSVLLLKREYIRVCVCVYDVCVCVYIYIVYIYIYGIVNQQLVENAESGALAQIQ